MNKHDLDRVRVLVARVRRAQQIITISTTEIEQIVTEAWDTEATGGPLANLLGSPLDNPIAMFSRPLVDLSAMTITWEGRSCSLARNRVLLRLMERLARRPDHYLTYDHLQREVWERRVSDEAIRNAVWRLKSHLRRKKMHTLAAAIQTDDRRCRLVLASEA